jgi:hypothetical protein
MHITMEGVERIYRSAPILCNLEVSGLSDIGTEIC